MDPKQIKISGLLMLAVIIGCFVSLGLLAREEKATPLRVGTLQFDADQTLQTTREFVTKFPRRGLGSIEARQSTGFLIGRLKSLGYEVSYAHFDAKIAGRTQVGRNVLAFKRGTVNETLAVIAHYDIAGKTVQGAMDNGSGIGVLLELARVFSVTPPRRNLLIIASDGEEWGMLGARDIAQHPPEHLAAVLSLDHGSLGQLAGFSLDTGGQLRGSTPPWLRALARAAALQEGLPVTLPGGLQEHLDRALAISSSDQGPFLDAGIPAINLNCVSSDPDLASSIRHSAQDSADRLQADSLGKFGRAAERIVLALDASGEIPRDLKETFCFGDVRCISPGVIFTLHCILFTPFLGALYFHLRNNHHYLKPLRILKELLCFVGTILPFLAVYYAIVLFRLMRLIPAYALYPPDAKDTALSNPSWPLLAGIFTIVLTVAAGAYAGCRFLNRKMPRPDFFISKTILLALFAGVIATALIYNSYWAVLFLLLPAWVWSLAGISAGQGSSIANRLWIIAAGIPCYALLLYYSKALDVGGKALWYCVLSLSTGLFTLEGYILASATIALGIRLLSISGAGDHMLSVHTKGHEGG